MTSHNTFFSKAPHRKTDRCDSFKTFFHTLNTHTTVWGYATLLQPYLNQVVPELRDCNHQCVDLILQISRNGSPATFSCSSCVSGIWSSSHGTQVIICFPWNRFFFYIIVKANSLSISKACFENWFYVKGYNISTILQGFSASHDKKNLLNSSFPAVLVLVDPLQHLGDVSLLQTSVNESEQSEGWALGFLCDSPLKTVSSSCQSQSQTHSRWQTRPVS